jgi:hypothetical protein
MHLWSSGVFRRFPVAHQKKSYNHIVMTAEDREACQHHQEYAQGVDHPQKRFLHKLQESAQPRRGSLCVAGYGDVLWGHNYVVDAVVEVCLQSAWGSRSLRPLSGLPTHVHTANWRTSDT